MKPAEEEKKAEKSYLTSAVDSLNPWASRSATPTQKDKEPSKEGTPDPEGIASGREQKDHEISHLYGQSLRTYPADCPSPRIQWFHAVDVPKRKPKLLHNQKRGAPPSRDTKAPTAPKKFTAFSPHDTRAIEARYQKLLEESEERKGNDAAGQSKVPVNEDFLFDVDIVSRELGPVYWLGPVYEVRRGSWFFQEGSTHRPCDENLAAQLEEGYLKTKPWMRPLSRGRSQSVAKEATSKGSQENLKIAREVEESKPSSKSAASSATSIQVQQPQSYRLFGTYMNSVVTYQDANTAWLSSEGVLSWVTSSVYEKLGGGGYMSGIKLMRGYPEPEKVKAKEASNPTRAKSTTRDDTEQRKLKRRSAPPSTTSGYLVEDSGQETVENDNDPRLRLQRQLSSLMEQDSKDPVEREEQINKREEQVMQDDYNAQVGETQGREIEHLVLVTHGIGQLLGLRMEAVNFVHDVNTMRKTLKSVYAASADLKALNSEIGTGPGNCRVQVLPVCWRHLLDFPKKRERKAEQDVVDDGDGEDEYPSLEDITVEGVAFARSLISDLALDVLLYQSSYREQISRIVLEESNRIYHLFRQRNPEFNGKVHLIGHSLGSAIYFDSLCRQKDKARYPNDKASNPLGFWPNTLKKNEDRKASTQSEGELNFEFDVADFYCLGSPVGLFQMLKGRTVSARNTSFGMPSESPLSPELVHDPFLQAQTPTIGEKLPTTSSLPTTVSSPKVEQLFNIFHPSDPVSYRIEPLISKSMATLKPQNLPYTKKGMFSNVAPQGLTGIGAKVGQGVSDLWSSFSAGIASNILNRSLGLTSEEVARLAATPATEHPPGAGTNISAGGVLQKQGQNSDKANNRKQELAASSRGSSEGKDAALIDDDLETLYSKFQSRSKKNEDKESDQARDEEWAEQGKKARKMRIEDGKVRALNRNGRVDYSIQESALDFNPINTIASHLGYWADEDVNHFMLSQLLSNKRKGGGSGERK